MAKCGSDKPAIVGSKIRIGQWHSIHWHSDAYIEIEIEIEIIEMEIEMEMEMEMKMEREMEMK